MQVPMTPEQIVQQVDPEFISWFQDEYPDCWDDFELENDDAIIMVHMAACSWMRANGHVNWGSVIQEE